MVEVLAIITGVSPSIAPNMVSETLTSIDWNSSATTAISTTPVPSPPSGTGIRRRKKPRLHNLLIKRARRGETFSGISQIPRGRGHVGQYAACEFARRQLQFPLCSRQGKIDGHPALLALGKIPPPLSQFPAGWSSCLLTIRPEAASQNIQMTVAPAGV